jgi:hypothetical protein
MKHNKHRLNGIVMLIALALLSGRAGATDYTWKTASGNWGTAANWNPSGTPGAGDVCTINSNSPCVANTDLTGNPEIQVYTNCTLDVATDLSSQTIVLDNGGSLRNDNNSYTTRRVSDPIKIQGTGYVVARSHEGQFSLNGPIQDGTSAGKLIAQWAADGKWAQPIYLRNTNNTYSGGTEVQAGRMNWSQGLASWADRLYATAPGCLGTGSVLVRSNGWLNLATTNTTGPGAVITVENGGKVEISANTAGHTILLKDGGQLRKDWSSYPSSSRTSADTIQIEGTASVVGGLNETMFTLTGLIQDGATPGRLVLDTEAFQSWGVGIALNRGTNTYSGGTEVRRTRNRAMGGQSSDSWVDWVYAKADGCMGTGPIIVYPDGWLNLALATAADWTLTNNISMGSKTAPQAVGDWTKANIKVQAGAHRLTAAGSVITPGAFTNAASVTTNTTGTLAINGKFAFARNNGTCATLAIGIAGTNGVAGVDYSQLSVSSGDATLAASITNCELSVTVFIKDFAGTMTVTNVVAPGADFSSNRFHSVTWNPGWKGTVQYGNGYILLTDIRSIPVGSVLMVY